MNLQEINVYFLTLYLINIVMPKMLEIQKHQKYYTALKTIINQIRLNKSIVHCEIGK